MPSRDNESLFVAMAKEPQYESCRSVAVEEIHRLSSSDNNVKISPASLGEGL